MATKTKPDTEVKNLKATTNSVDDDEEEEEYEDEEYEEEEEVVVQDDNEDDEEFDRVGKKIDELLNRTSDLRAKIESKPPPPPPPPKLDEEEEEEEEEGEESEYEVEEITDDEEEQFTGEIDEPKIRSPSPVAIGGHLRKASNQWDISKVTDDDDDDDAKGGKSPPVKMIISGKNEDFGQKNSIPERNHHQHHQQPKKQTDYDEEEEEIDEIEIALEDCGQSPQNVIEEVIIEEEEEEEEKEQDRTPATDKSPTNNGDDDQVTTSELNRSKREVPTETLPPEAETEASAPPLANKTIEELPRLFAQTLVANIIHGATAEVGAGNRSNFLNEQSQRTNDDGDDEEDPNAIAPELLSGLQMIDRSKKYSIDLSGVQTSPVVIQPESPWQKLIRHIVLTIIIYVLYKFLSKLIFG